MSLFIANLVLAVLWGAIRGEFGLLDLMAGFLGGYLVLLAARPVLGRSAYYFGLWRAIAFATFWAWELLRSSLRVTRQVLTPRLRVRPGVVAIPLDATSDAEITFLANLITITPGSVSLDVSADRGTLYVHFMDVPGGNAEAVRRDVKERLERRVLALLR